MRISNVNGRDKVEICEIEEIKSSSSIKAVDKNYFHGMFALGRHHARHRHPKKERNSYGQHIRDENGIINIGEDSKTQAEGQHLSKESRPNEGLGKRLKHTPGASLPLTGGGEREEIKAKLKEISRERSTTQGSYRLRRGGRY